MLLFNKSIHVLDFVDNEIFQWLIVLISQAVHLGPITDWSKELGIRFEYENCGNRHRQNDKDKRWNESVKERKLFRRFGVMTAAVPVGIVADCCLKWNHSVADESCLGRVESINISHFWVVRLAIISVEMLARFVISAVFFRDCFERWDSVVVEEYWSLIGELSQWLW